MPNYACHCAALITALLMIVKGNCQPANDSIFYQSAVANVKATYFNAVKERSNLYNGTAYEAFGHGASGTPFFTADSLFDGSVFYDGVLYTGLYVKYDLVNDEFVTNYYGGNGLLQLIKSKVGYFYIDGHHFIRLSENMRTPEELSGFFELLFKGARTAVFVKRSKRLQLSPGAEDRSSVFVQYDQIYVYNGGKYYPVNSEGTLLKIFGDKAGDVNNFLRAKKIRYKRGAEQATVAAATFYNDLIKKNGHI